MATKVCQEGHDGRLRHKHSQKGRAQGAGDHLNLHLHRVQQSSSRSRCAPPRTVLARRLRQAQDAGLHTHALLHGRQSTRLCRLPVAHAGAATFGALTHIHARAHTHAHVHTHVHLILAPWEFATHMRTWYWPPGSLPHTRARTRAHTRPPGTGLLGAGAFTHIHAHAHTRMHGRAHTRAPGTGPLGAGARSELETSRRWGTCLAGCAARGQEQQQSGGPFRGSAGKKRTGSW